MNTSCCTTVQQLREGGVAQSTAIKELQELLERRLSFSFRKDSTVDAAFVEDIVQDSLVKILASLEQFEGRSKFTTWATTIAIRTAYTELRKRHWKDRSLEQMMERQGDFLPTPSSDKQNQSDRERLIQAMMSAIKEKLTDKQRFALLAELEGWPLEEIGRQTGSNRNAVYKLTHDARKRLRRELEAKGFTAADYRDLQENST